MSAYSFLHSANSIGILTNSKKSSRVKVLCPLVSNNGYIFALSHRPLTSDIPARGPMPPNPNKIQKTTQLHTHTPFS